MKKVSQNFLLKRQYKKPKLRFLGIKRSSLRGFFPFRQILNYRDRSLAKNDLGDILRTYPVTESIDSYEVIVSYPDQKMNLIVRKFPESDLAIFKQVYIDKCYEPLFNALKRRFHRNSQIRVIDAGANVGFFSTMFSSQFPSAKIVGIEPSYENFLVARHNTLKNGLDCTLLVGGLWPNSGFLNLRKDFRDGRSASLTTQQSANETPIKAYTFGEILNLQGWNDVDCLKMDIEGSERFLFGSREQADFILSKTNFIAIEIHDEFKSREVIISHLVRHGFSYEDSGDLTIAIRALHEI